MIEVLANVTVAIILQNNYQINMLNTLNFHSIKYQVHLHTAGAGGGGHLHQLVY